MLKEVFPRWQQASFLLFGYIEAREIEALEHPMQELSIRGLSARTQALL